MSIKRKLSAGEKIFLMWILFISIDYRQVRVATHAFPASSIHGRINAPYSFPVTIKLRPNSRMILQAVSNQHCGVQSSSSHGIPSNMAREAAVIVEVEPISELERRIEEGIHYKHLSEYEVHKEANGSYRDMPKNEEIARGVFVGYFVTTEERTRLKSANVNDNDV